MTPEQLQVQAVAVVVAVACAIPGTFLVLRRMALMSDAISHAILLGIVLAWFVTGDLGSPLLVGSAAATGMVTVVLVEALRRTGRLAEDAAIGLVFPALFSVGVVLIARNAGNVHLDVDSVLLGEIAFAPFHRWVVNGVDMGPLSLYVMGGILLLNLLFVLLFFKELKLATFDAGLAATLGFLPAAVHYGLMGLVSVTAVGAFDAVGTVLVVALMIAPASAAYLLTDSLGWMIFLAALLGACSALSGYWAAHALDASIAGSMAAMSGLYFLAAYLLAPDRGVVAALLRRRRQRWEFALATLLIHLLQHEGLPEAVHECRLEHLSEHLRWRESFAAEVIGMARRRGFVVARDAHLALTEEGRGHARKSMQR